MGVKRMPGDPGYIPPEGDWPDDEDARLDEIIDQATAEHYGMKPDPWA